MFKLPIFLLVGTCIAIAVPETLADSEKYDKGTINILCKCLTPTINRAKADWHEIFTIPRDGFTLDMSRVCKNSFKNHVGPDMVCKATDKFVGKEYAFDSK